MSVADEGSLGEGNFYREGEEDSLAGDVKDEDDVRANVGLKRSASDAQLSSEEEEEDGGDNDEDNMAYACNGCRRLFKNQQGLSAHRQHCKLARRDGQDGGVRTAPGGGQYRFASKTPRAARKRPPEEVVPQEVPVPPEVPIQRERDPSVDGRRSNKGQAKRRVYTYMEKLQIIQDYEAVLKERPSITLREYVTEHDLPTKFRVFLTAGKNGWRNPDTYNNIIAYAADEKLAGLSRPVRSPQGRQRRDDSMRNTRTPDFSQHPPATLLVIESEGYDWAQIFSRSRLAGGRGIEVVQTSWDDILVRSDTYSNDHRPIVEIRSASKEVRPDFVLIRNEVKTPAFDARHLLSGFLFADVPSVNSLSSIHQFCDRSAVMGALHKIHRRLGNEFPVIKQHFTSSSRSLMYEHTFPAVVKVGCAHATAGKMKIEDHHQLSDFRSVLGMMANEHCLVEPFIEEASDLRIQKIGTQYRAFRRTEVTDEWKTETTSVMAEVPMKPHWKRWADESSNIFGGLDILTVHAVTETETEREYILEVNGTSSVLHPECADQDNIAIRKLVIKKMNKFLMRGQIQRM